MFTIQIYRDSDVLTGANIAIMNNLFINGWTLYPTLEKLFTEKQNIFYYRIAIGSLNDEPICVVIYRDLLDNCLTRETNINYFANIQAFCKKEHRRKGYTSQCIIALNPRNDLFVEEGIEGSIEFWNKNGFTNLFE